ncbi:hypothetical protein CLOP_g8598 [Closterium sp. NIES-67]|nr:hypothetical protein CLOP_g8598 [Closterium sp. NIES-67]
MLAPPAARAGPAELLRAMAAQRCGGSWLRVLRFAWAVEEAWGLRRGSDSEVEVGGGEGKRGCDAAEAALLAADWAAAAEGEDEASLGREGGRRGPGLTAAVYAGDYCSFQIKTSGELWVYGSGTRDGTPQFAPPRTAPTHPAPVVPTPAPNQPPPNQPAPRLSSRPQAAQGWAAAASSALAAGLAAVRLGASTAGSGSAAAIGSAVGSERLNGRTMQQAQQGGGRRGRRGSLKAHIVVGEGASGGAGGDGGNHGAAAGASGVGYYEEHGVGGGGREEDRVVQVAGGRAFTVILTEAEEVYTMGQDSNGCCGHGQEGAGKKFSQPKLVEALRGVPCQQVATGRSHTLVLATDGTVYAFGAGGNGRLGIGDTDDRCGQRLWRVCGQKC